MNKIRALRILILYEGSSAVARAYSRIERFLAEAKSECAAETSLWGFDEIHAFPQLRERATAEILAADIIFIATRNVTKLPVEAWKWVESWAPQQKGRRATLVALVGQGNPSPLQPLLLEAYLRQIAEIGGMEFVVEAAEPTSQRIELASLSAANRVLS